MHVHNSFSRLCKKWISHKLLFYFQPTIFSSLVLIPTTSEATAEGFNTDDVLRQPVTATSSDSKCQELYSKHDHTVIYSKNWASLCQICIRYWLPLQQNTTWHLSSGFFADGNTHWNDSKSSRGQTVAVNLLPKFPSKQTVDVMLSCGQASSETFRWLTTLLMCRAVAENITLR